MRVSGGNELQSAADEDVVQRARAITGEVERHVAKAVALPGLDDTLAQLRIDEAGKLRGVDLDAGDRVVPADPDLAKAERLEFCLERSDLGQALARDAGSVGNAARQARGRGFVPDVEPDAARGGAHVVLAHARFDQ